MRVKPTSSLTSSREPVAHIEGKFISRSQKVHTVSLSHIDATNTKFDPTTHHRSFVADSRSLRREDQIAASNLATLVQSYGQEYTRPRSRTHKYDVLSNRAVC